MLQQDRQPERGEDELREEVERDVHHDARGRESPGHARARESLRSNDVPADVERRQQLVDRFRDPPRPDHRPQARSLDRRDHGVPAEGARRDRHDVKQRYPQETGAGGGERPRELAGADIDDERRQERQPTGESRGGEGDEAGRQFPTGSRQRSQYSR